VETMSVELYTGAKMPIIGLGTWKSKKGEVGDAVKYALNNGYTHIDCAMCYGNESEVGEALKASLGVIKRSDLWVTSKLWNTFHDPKHVRDACKKTLSDLGLDYVDLFLMHWPHAFQFHGFEYENFFPKNEDGSIKYSDVDYLDTWKAMENLVDEGLVKHIGFSNFNSEQIQRVLDNCRIKPAVLQVEMHPYFTQEKLVKFVRERGLALTAYSPLGSPDRPWASKEDPSLFEDITIKKIAEKYQKSVAQILIRFPIDRGISVVPKSVTPSRISENRNVLDFSLSKEDVDTLLSLHRNYRACPLTRDKVHKYWPFAIEY